MDNFPPHAEISAFDAKKNNAYVWANNEVARQILVQALVTENKRMQSDARRRIKKFRAAGDHDRAEQVGNTCAEWVEVNRRLMCQLWPDRADDINANTLDFG